MENTVVKSQSSPASSRSGLLEWLSTLPVFLLLTLTLVIGTGEMIHGQLLRLGESFFGDPATGVQYSFLRADPSLPECNANPDIEAEVQKKMSAPADDEFGGLFGNEVKNPDDIRKSITQAKQECAGKHAFYSVIKQHITPTVRVYRTFETAFFAIFRFGTENRSLILILLVCVAGLTTTLGKHHIALRPPETKKDFLVYNSSMVLASSLLLYSAVKYWFSQKASGLEIDTLLLVINGLWIGLFTLLLLMSLYLMFKPNPEAKDGGSILSGFLCVPLFAAMANISGIAFIVFMNYPTGIMIYLGQMMDMSAMYLQIALYIWAGVLLKRSNLVEKFLDIARPFNFSPETLTLILMIGAAYLTAYTGASGIFVIAAGGLIYKEVLAAGARPQYALAATAMSGSLGVVLNPCLLIVLIAALNKQITTDELFHYGRMVFVISILLFFFLSLLLAKDKFHVKNPMKALPEAAKKLLAALPYVLIVVAVVVVYRGLLNTKLDEFTAPQIIPLIMLALVAYDNWGGKRKAEAAYENKSSGFKAAKEVPGVYAAIRGATTETVGHIGALILLMGLSVSVGGLIDRLELFAGLPTFGNMWLALSIFMLVLVVIGMFMDPYGALILVTAVIAPVAYENGINPIHFWMIALTAFELGYLSPPVAVNQLIARQSVGELEMQRVDDSVKDLPFFWRYERWILPLMIMGATMLIVTYAPYFFQMFGWYIH